MRNRVFGILFCCLLPFLQSCGNETTTPADGGGGKETIDQGNPVLVVEAMFAIASGKAPASLLASLCDPLGENDDDTRRICDFANGFDPEGEFAMFFKEGKINGPAAIEGDFAQVPFLFGPDGQDSETMDLVRRNGKWYLTAF